MWPFWNYFRNIVFSHLWPDPEFLNKILSRSYDMPNRPSTWITLYKCLIYQTYKPRKIFLDMRRQFKCLIFLIILNLTIIHYQELLIWENLNWHFQTNTYILNIFQCCLPSVYLPYQFCKKLKITNHLEKPTVLIP